MEKTTELVITGLGVVSSIGTGVEEFWNSLLQGKSGVGVSDYYTAQDVAQINRLPYPMTAEVKTLETKRIKPRKNIKVMARDIQLGFIAADYARENSLLEQTPVDPERQGIVFGALMIIVDVSELEPLYKGAIGEDGQFVPPLFGNEIGSMFPLWMLKYLPNMTPCHIAIAYDMRGPNNTLVIGEPGGLSALVEASRVLRRGAADVMLAGGCASCTMPSAWFRYDLFQLSKHFDDPQKAYRPFDANRDGLVLGEGAAVCVLETSESAKKRGAPVYAKFLGYGEATEPVWHMQTDFAPAPEEVRVDRARFTGSSLKNAMRLALDRAGLNPSDIAFVMASANGSVSGDLIEAQAIADVLGSDVPVSSVKGATGYAMPASASMEVVASALALKNRLLPHIATCEEKDPACPIDVVMNEPRPLGEDKKAAMILSCNFYGQATAVIIGRGE
ncbi:MAG: beta-ketoacyl-[acyl-carrier-protein] synthase family protein [Planctomycetia bacterium]|nr:beta-ketoacyl-[acyl-carrier-protein] synthase family protein [Planctomycetia bacterium]